MSDIIRVSNQSPAYRSLFGTTLVMVGLAYRVAARFRLRESDLWEAINIHGGSITLNGLTFTFA